MNRLGEFNEFCIHISQTAIKSMLYEVAATPKPGLVDRSNSGAHLDMNFYTFMASSSVLPFTFYECALAGLNFEKRDIRDLLDIIRPIGLRGEHMMFSATSGINTHKGLIFSLGVISAAAGYIYGKNKNMTIEPYEVCHVLTEMTEGITDRELMHIEKKEKLTYGEYLFKEYGIRGIRGEVESGFPIVQNVGLPVLERLINDGSANLNDILVHTLLNIMAEAEDSNVIGRNGLTALEYVKISAKMALKAGGMLTEEGREIIYKLDEEYIKRNISPGGSADLLAITIMLYFMKNHEKAAY